MEKRFFWAAQKAQDKILVIRFRSEAERMGWIQNGTDMVGWGIPPIYRIVLNATDPEVRRIQRRMAQGEQITFPVEIN
jgi:hypothetical protein